MKYLKLIIFLTIFLALSSIAFSEDGIWEIRPTELMWSNTLICNQNPDLNPIYTPGYDYAGLCQTPLINLPLSNSNWFFSSKSYCTSFQRGATITDQNAPGMVSDVVNKGRFYVNYTQNNQSIRACNSLVPCPINNNIDGIEFYFEGISDHFTGSIQCYASKNEILHNDTLSIILDDGVINLGEFNLSGHGTYKISSPNPKIKVFFYDTGTDLIDDATASNTTRLSACLDIDQNNECDASNESDANEIVCQGGGFAWRNTDNILSTYDDNCCGDDIEDEGRLITETAVAGARVCAKNNLGDWAWILSSQIHLDGDIFLIKNNNIPSTGPFPRENTSFDAVSNDATWIACDALDDGIQSFTGTSLAIEEKVAYGANEYLCYYNNNTEQFGECIGSGVSQNDFGTSGTTHTSGELLRALPQETEYDFDWEIDMQGIEEEFNDQMLLHIKDCIGVWNRAGVKIYEQGSCENDENTATIANNISLPVYNGEVIWVYPRRDYLGNAHINSFELCGVIHDIQKQKKFFYYPVTCDGNITFIEGVWLERITIYLGTDVGYSNISHSDTDSGSDKINITQGPLELTYTKLPDQVMTDILYTAISSNPSVLLYFESTGTSTTTDRTDRLFAKIRYEAGSYCASDGTWITDLDNSNKETCEAAGYEWTGTLCCGDDYLDTYNDENAPPVGDIGGCFRDTKIPHGTAQNFNFTTRTEAEGILASLGLGPQHITERYTLNLLNHNGVFYGCNLNDTTIQIPKDNNNDNLIHDDRNMSSCTSLGARLCSPNGIWHPGDPATIAARDTIKTLPPAYINSEGNDDISCCAATSCWNGTSCVADETSTTITYPLVDSSITYKCTNGNWTTVSETCRWDDPTNCGFCDDGTECYLDQDTCIESEYYYKDHYCDDGDWSTRTKFLAQTLSELIDTRSNQQDYALFCGNFTSTLNRYDYLSLTGEEIEEYVRGRREFVPLTTYKCPGLDGPCVNNFCIARYTDIADGEKIVVGTSLNQPVNADELSFLEALEKDKNYCTSLINTNSSFTSCSSLEDVWYNDKSNLIIYSKQTVDLAPLTFLETFLNWIIHPIQSITAATNPSTLQTIPLIDQAQAYSDIYAAFSDPKAITALLETDKGFLLANYSNFNQDICLAIDEYDQSKFGGTNVLVCNKTNDQYLVYNQNESGLVLWHDLTARLRIS
ncbi:MAG: hypothetical protein V3V78_00540 [Candidatus Woesearchaeota archaeon]